MFIVNCIQCVRTKKEMCALKKNYVTSQIIIKLELLNNRNSDIQFKHDIEVKFKHNYRNFMQFYWFLCVYVCVSFCC
jgi:hypothetical protein